MTAPVHHGTGLVDLHCHILPGLDDGARDLSDACAMAAIGAQDGITAICATPHIRHDHDVEIATLPARRQSLCEALHATRCGVQVLAGGEIATTALPGLSEAELAAVSLGGGGRWILLEPAPGPLDGRLDRAVAWLSARGLGAVIAHPERRWADDLEQRLDRLVAEGCLIQATAAFLCQAPTQAGMLALARRGLVHVLGSDAHSARWGRPVALQDAFAVLAGEAAVAPHLEWMRVTAPRAIIAGEPLSPPF